MNTNWTDYLSLISPEYLEELRLRYEKDPSLVPSTWRLFFDGMDFSLESDSQVESKLNSLPAAPNKLRSSESVGTEKSSSHPTPQLSQKTVNQMTDNQIATNQIAASRIIENYRRFGHHRAQLSPLKSSANTFLTQVDDTYYLEPAGGAIPAEIKSHLVKTYCENIGAEFMHIDNEKQRNWIAQRLEASDSEKALNKSEKVEILNRLTQAEGFEQFLQKNFTGQKRFSLEGGESLVVAMDMIHQQFARHGGREVVIAMAHRGRLNVLTNILKKPFSAVFAEFEGLKKDSGDLSGGDVKYHMGFSSDLVFNDKPLHLSLAFNPSHLEAAYSVMEGMARAKQMRTYDGDFNKVLPLVIHGDAAVVGQGVVTETMNLCHLSGYKTGGTIHLVINNQLGFTTDPKDARSTNYCTDFAKAIQVPIFHVNGNKPEQVAFVSKLAAEFRNQFQSDVFVDIYCYRKYGHNEGDEPKFTQPLMYDEISRTLSPRSEYSKDLISLGVISADDDLAMVRRFQTQLDMELQSLRNGTLPDGLKPFQGIWDGLKSAKEEEVCSPVQTNIESKTFDLVVDAIHGPFEVEVLPKLQKMLDQRKTSLQSEDVVDWAVSEQLAFGSLLQDGYSVRLSGQDSRRGTFSHRHLELTDHKTSKRQMPLKKLENKSYLSAWNSPLSEFAVMGFDYGFSLADPKTLVLWEGQFGDFVNGAQIVIDQFLAACEKKWNRSSGLTLLLPHGYEGQGPEHSSARLERFLQLCAEGNLQVCYPTTPAQFFHLLRRQMLRTFRKPLILMTPKSPLRMPEVVSKKKDFINGGFQDLILSGSSLPEAKQVILCSGKVYWDLLKATKSLGREGDVAFIRLEQLYPIDKKLLFRHLRSAKSCKDFVWCQEEPKNMGAWSFLVSYLSDELQGLVSEIGPRGQWRYAGRKASASPATGYLKTHQKELETLISDCLRS